MDQLIAQVLAAILAVESGGNWAAIGDGGLARGGYQIHRAAWNDACKFGGMSTGLWRWEQHAHDPYSARVVATLYLHRYGAAYEKRTGKPVTAEVLARIWSGGPNGWRKPSTRGYWAKVKGRLASK